MDPFSFLLWRFYYFFRDPPRTAPEGRVIVSPADGYILYIKEIAPGATPSPTKKGSSIVLHEWPPGLSLFDARGILIGIYMAPWSVHYNRAPVSGMVTKIISSPAKSKNLSMARALMRLLWDLKPYEKDSTYINQNARNIIVFEGEISAAVIQIADRYVNQIDCFVRPGEQVQTGAKVGMIRMGSQVDLFLPETPRVELRCKIRDKVSAGTTVLGTY
ncbi:MAG: phosphatidylserine decarboxylase [Deltaproteobacteria bacterium]|nr:phosphatidylserine decarboxylase [Deltaproteobacteria bacterium]